MFRQLTPIFFRTISWRGMTWHDEATHGVTSRYPDRLPNILLSKSQIIFKNINLKISAITVGTGREKILRLALPVRAGESDSSTRACLTRIQILVIEKRTLPNRATHTAIPPWRIPLTAYSNIVRTCFKPCSVFCNIYTVNSGGMPVPDLAASRHVRNNVMPRHDVDRKEIVLNRRNIYNTPQLDRADQTVVPIPRRRMYELYHR